LHLSLSYQYILSLVYGVAMIGTLNQRQYFKGKEPWIITDANVQLSDIVSSTYYRNGRGESRGARPVEIHKSVQMTVDSEYVVNIKLKNSRIMGDQSTRVRNSVV